MAISQLFIPTSSGFKILRKCYCQTLTFSVTLHLNRGKQQQFRIKKRDNKTSGLACPRFQYMDDYYQQRFNTNQNFTQHEPSPLQEIENRLLALQPCNNNKSTKTSLTGLTSISAPAIVPCRNRKILALCVFRI